MSGDLKESMEQAIEKAKERGDTIIFGAPSVLIFDIDSAERMAQFNKAFSRLAEIIGPPIAMDRWQSRQGGEHWHIRIIPANAIFDVAERLMIQAVLGSDPMKELLSYQRYKEGITEPSVLFQPKQEPKKDDDDLPF